MSARVQGQCPMGCGDTLFVGSGGYVTVSVSVPASPVPDVAPPTSAVIGEVRLTDGTRWTCSPSEMWEVRRG